MPPKSERFELRLDEAFLAKVDAWRFSQPSEPSRAEAIRALVEAGLKAHASDAPRFTDGEKLITFMLAEVMKSVVKEPEIDPAYIIEAMAGGDYWAIPFAYSGPFPQETCPREVVTEVANILDMCDFLESSIEKFSPQDRKRLAERFPYIESGKLFTGFDGNSDYNHIGVVRILVDKLGRFSRFKGRPVNSHSSTSLGRYTRMYKVFEPVRSASDGLPLSLQVVERILEAGFSSQS